MGTEIGYLQIKIRELQEQNILLTQKIEQSLKREENIIAVINQTLNEKSTTAEANTEQFLKGLITNKIDLMYKEKFEYIFNQHYNKMSEDIILNAKGFNHSIECLLKEIALLKKDNSFIMSLICQNSKITVNEFEYFAKEFDKKYNSSGRLEKDLNKFKMSFYKNREDVKKIIGETKDE
jgi:hypothetical protein